MRHFHTRLRVDCPWWRVRVQTRRKRFADERIFDVDFSTGSVNSYPGGVKRRRRRTVGVLNVPRRASPFHNNNGVVVVGRPNYVVAHYLFQRFLLAGNVTWLYKLCHGDGHYLGICKAIQMMRRDHIFYYKKRTIINKYILNLVIL